MSLKVQRSTFTSQEAAEYLGVSLSTLYKYVHEEGLPVLRFPGRRKFIFKKEYIDKWIENRMNIDGQFEEKYEQEYGKLRVLRP